MTEKENKTESKPAIKQSKASVKKTAAAAHKVINTTTTTPKAVPTNADSSSSVNGFVLLLVISVINLSAVGYLWFINQQQTAQQTINQKQQEKQLVELAESVQKQQQSVASLSVHKHQDLDRIRAKIENLSRLSLTMQSQLNLTQQQVNQAGKGISQDLLLSEADFLIRTAAIRLLLTENVSETTNLLKAADEKLVKINNVAIFPVRAALTKDLYQLKATSQIDIIGTYLILENLEKSINGLKINFILPEITSSEKPPQNSDEDWYQHLSNTTENVINDWFQVTHYNEEIKPLVSKQQDIIIKQSIVLLIKQAQWALIQKNMALYQLTLKNLSEQIGAAFNKQDPIVKNTLVEIKGLLSESIVTPISKYLNSEKAMKVYLEASVESSSHEN